MGKTSTKQRSHTAVGTLQQVGASEIDVRIANLELEIEKYQENAQLALAFDNLGWVPLDGCTDRGIGLEKIKQWSEVNQALVGANPLIDKAVEVRVALIFGEGIAYGEPGTKLTPRAQGFLEEHADKLFSQQAYQELETALCTSGQVFLLLEKNGRKVTRVPLTEITGVATRDGDEETIMYIKRTWSVTKSTASVSSDSARSASTEQKSEWYPVPTLPAGTRKPSSIDDVPMSTKAVMLHISVNKQIGWTWGVPDIQPSRNWAKAYKDFLEDQFLLVKSLARFSWKVTSKTAAQANRSAVKIATPVEMGPNGFPVTTGATASTSEGGDIAAINKAGANVNFEAGKPLAVMALAGLGVPYHLVLPDKGTSGDDTLDIPTLKSMSSRQALYERMFEKMFSYFGLNVNVIFPPIQQGAIHRVIQAIVTAASTNAVHPKEIRKMLVLALRPLGIDPESSLPRAGAMAKFVGGAALTNPGTTPQKTPDASGGKKSPAGPLADGDHEQRDSEEGISLSDAILSLVETLRSQQ